jgi:hypothetical protein
MSAGKSRTSDKAIKLENNAFKEVKQNHKDLISKVETLNIRRQESEDTDLIFYHVLDAVKLVHQKIKNEQEGKSQESYQLAGFLNRFERWRKELQSLRSEIESMYNK